jgi:Uncharacterized conserved protein (DUF2285)
LRIQDVGHRLWLREPHVVAARYAAELPVDNDFEIRALATRQFWRALNRRSAGSPFMNCPHSVDSDWPWQCARSMAALRATATRAIVEGLFGANHIPERTWKTHDRRNRTIRLVQSGFALMRGGYREPRRQSRRKK